MPTSRTAPTAVAAPSDRSESCRHERTSTNRTAGASMTVVELLRAHRPHAIFGEQPPAAHRQAAPPPEAITREDLLAAIAEMQAKNAAANAERDKAQTDLIQQMKSLMDSLVTQLRTAKREIESLRAMNVEHRRARNANVSQLAEARARAAQLEHELAMRDVEMDDADDSTEIETSDEVEASDDAEAATESDENPIADPVNANVDSAAEVPLRDAEAKNNESPETLAHFQAISALLNDDDRRQLSALIATMPKDVVERAQARMTAMSPAEAVVYLRTVVFPSAGAHA